MTKQIEVWILIDENGDHEVGPTVEDAGSRWDENVSGGTDVGRRMIKVTLNVPLPKHIELTWTVSAEEAAELVESK